jgi:hypothetical protein
MIRYLIVILLLISSNGKAQSTIEQFPRAVLMVDSSVTLAFDEGNIIDQRPTQVIIYALPNGNTTAQTFGKKLKTGDDWHFDIQHIGAQTKFIRATDNSKNYIVVYAENSLKSWPSWRKNHQQADSLINVLISGVYLKYKSLKPEIVLCAHSGGGSLIFGYINANAVLPSFIKRIGFLDATYGYETEKHQAKLKNWLSNKNNSLQVISYNDSVVVYNGKPLVSPTGGTWYKSKLMAYDLQKLKKEETDSYLKWNNRKGNINLLLVKNPEAKIYHTVLVEKNGFIHAILNGTPYASKNYQFWAERAYESFILE